MVLGRSESLWVSWFAQRGSKAIKKGILNITIPDKLRRKTTMRKTIEGYYIAPSTIAKARKIKTRTEHKCALCDCTIPAKTEAYLTKSYFHGYKGKLEKIQRHICPNCKSLEWREPPYDVTFTVEGKPIYKGEKMRKRQ